MISGPGDEAPLLGALDQGTSSSRFMVFRSGSAELVTYHQQEVQLIYPQQGWVESDPRELYNSSLQCIDTTVSNLRALHIDEASIAAIGITNQRETTIVWDRCTGEPLYNAIVWLDTRTTETVEALINRCPDQNKNYLKPLCGLPISTYFSAVKLRWLLDNVSVVAQARDRGALCFGTVDTWLLWNLTGGVNGGVYLTDVTNASRTMLMNINSLQWDPFLCRFFDIPVDLLPKIVSSSEIYGQIKTGLLSGKPISGLLGDQQAALVGQMCLKQGQAKNTYGTGCFLLYNTGHKIVQSERGLLTTVAYQLGPDSPAVYALEGSVAIAGAAVRWLRDNLGMISSSDEVETLAASVPDAGGVYFVPAFSGLYAPHWDTRARGTVCGLTQYSNKRHICRAVLEAICFQTCEILSAMRFDSGLPLKSLQVDGGAVSNNLLLQLQSDLLGIAVVRPSMVETTALGAAVMAGACREVGVWKLPSSSSSSSPEESDTPASTTDIFVPSMSEEEREARLEMWNRAVERSKDWLSNTTSRHPRTDLSERSLNLLRSVTPSLFVVTSLFLLCVASRLSASTG